MKKIILGAAVLAAMMATSCQNEELVASQEQGNVVVKASTMNESRTFVQGRTIYWSEGDGLLAYGEDVLGSLTLVGQGGSTDGEFVGYVSGKKENLEYLVYPAEMASYKDGKVTIEIGTINKANSNAPMFAQWGSNVTFEQLTGMVRIQINDVPAKNNDLEVIGKGIGTAVFENGKITTYSTKDNTIKVTGLTAGSNEICIPVFTKNTTAQDVKLTFKLAGATKELTLPLAQKALTATNVPVLTYDATNKTLSEDTTLPESGNESEIKTLTELYQFANLVKEGNTYEGKTVTLGANIDMDNMPWTPILGFKGTFDGAEFTIYNLNVAVEGTASAGLFADGIGATIKNLKLQNVNVNGNWRTGAIIGDGSCVTIENCHVNGGNVTSTPHLISGKYDDGNHAGGIVGYLAADGVNASVTDCSVTGLTISAYRDVAGIAGTVTAADGGIPTVENNKVTATTIIADQTVDYVSPKAANAGEIVGREVVEPIMSGNTVGEGVSIGTLVATAAQLNYAINTVSNGQTIVLANGTYEGLFDLTDKNLTIQAANKNQAIINGLVWANNCTVTLKGLKLTNSKGEQHPNTTNSKFFKEINNQYPLIGAYNFAAITVDECTLDLTGPTIYGFYGHSHNTPVFKNSVFNCNKIRPIASNGPALTVTGCTFNDQYHYSARIYENGGNKQTIVFTNNTIQGSNDKGEFEGINISKKGNTATIFADFTIKGNTNVKYRHHKNVTMDATCTYETDITNFAFEKEN